MTGDRIGEQAQIGTTAFLWVSPSLILGSLIFHPWTWNRRPPESGVLAGGEKGEDGWAPPSVASVEVMRKTRES